VIESRVSRFSCPLKAGLIEYKGGKASEKAMKEFSPMFVTSEDKKDSITFYIKVTFMSKIGGKMENLMEYIENEFKMSDL
jgi:hypothetical protein